VTEGSDPLLHGFALSLTGACSAVGGLRHDPGDPTMVVERPNYKSRTRSKSLDVVRNPQITP